jgi:hypothetical protein
MLSPLLNKRSGETLLDLRVEPVIRDLTDSLDVLGLVRGLPELPPALGAALGTLIIVASPVLAVVGDVAVERAVLAGVVVLLRVVHVRRVALSSGFDIAVAGRRLVFLVTME